MGEKKKYSQSKSFNMQLTVYQKRKNREITLIGKELSK